MATDILTCIRLEIDQAILSNPVFDLQEALEYYANKRPEPLDDGTTTKFSDYISPEIQNAVEATIAEIMPGLCQDVPVTFVAIGPQDDAQCDIESEIVNHIVMTICKGYSVINRAFKDALLFRAGIAKVYWDERIVPMSRRIYNVPDNEFALMVQQGAPVSLVARTPNGNTIDLKEILRSARPNIEWVPLEEFLVNSDHNDVNFDNARLVGHRRQVPASDLIAMGIPREIVDNLGTSDYIQRLPRNSYDTGMQDHIPDESNQWIVVCESYYRFDEDGDGIAELRRVITGGGGDGHDELLLNDPWYDQPFICGVPYFGVRGWKGVSLFDRLKNIQDGKSDISRQILDAGWRNLLGRTIAMENLVNMDDLLTAKKGGVIRARSTDAVVPMKDAPLPPESFQLLTMFDKSRKESGGGAIDSTEQMQNMRDPSAHGVERLLSAMETLNAYVARNLVFTFICPLYLKVHLLLKLHWPGIIQTKIKGTWLAQVPAQWAFRNDVTIRAGLTTGDRYRQQLGLQEHFVALMQLLPLGFDGILVSPTSIYKTLTDSLRLKGVNSPTSYTVDPNSQEGQNAQQQKVKIAQQTKQEQAAQAEQQAQVLVHIEQLRQLQRKYETDMKLISDNNSLMIKLIELNAKFDQAEVPDTIGETTK